MAGGCGWVLAVQAQAMEALQAAAGLSRGALGGSSVRGLHAGAAQAPRVLAPRVGRAKALYALAASSALISSSTLAFALIKLLHMYSHLILEGVWHCGAQILYI